MITKNDQEDDARRYEEARRDLDEACGRMEAINRKYLAEYGCTFPVFQLKQRKAAVRESQR